MLLSLDQSAEPLARALERFIRGTDFPCVGAKAALARRRLFVCIARDICSSWDDLRIHHALASFVRLFQRRHGDLWSFAVIFRNPEAMSEVKFEASLWARLQSLTDKDAWLGFKHDPNVSSDPAHPDFGLSFAHEGFFAVGLHPNASRPARRFEANTIILNPHAQFRALRASGRYERMRETILARDATVAGGPNPMLARHGTVSEARQYSGREVSDDWKCTFSRNEVNDARAA